MHVSTDARAKYEVPVELLTEHGAMVFEDLPAAQELAYTMNRVRDARRFPESAVRAGDLYAAGLMDEIMRLALTIYRERTDPTAFAAADAHLQETVGAERVDEVLLTFASMFPALPVYRDGEQPAAYLARTAEGRTHREIVLEELLMLRIGNLNPGRVRFRELFSDLPLEQQTEYRGALAALDQFFDDRPGPGAGGGESIVSMLRAPARVSPTSLEGQLEYVRQHWAGLLGEWFDRLLERLLRAIDVLVEERKMGGFGGPAGPPPVLDAASFGPVEYERFSTDSSWMPSVVMLAKSTFVWLDQLAKQYRTEISRLDQVPDEELDRLAAAGFTGLWLIGIWERSEASRRIKQMRGDHDAVASAYSLYDYAIAADLGGEGAYENLRDRAWKRGIRLASDMVPNHVGIDGRWVIEHPDWFLSLDHSPYPGYSFTGEDLSSEDRISVQIEDHYWDGTDAAVVFKRYDHDSGETRFIYHGNDGTSMPWNDTAQLDYLNPETREAVIQTILHVARKFPIIRFDAAMTLATRHIQRLWFPPPGEGGAIPSRAQYGMSAEDFARALPTEFWREVVDRVATEVPDTLLLAEAFWMLEGYFVRTLGMHRVYNSAFMHMTSREDNGDYRQLMKNVLEFDPEVLKRFVNFMSNPDEETAIAQFGKDDKYFGVATLMATMPGLPMFGHGQIEGYTEKYGMEFRRPKWDEWPDQWLVERHQRELFPLLHRRWQFAEVGGFLMYDCVTGSGDVNQDVFAYSNVVGDARSLVLYNNRFGDAHGWIKTSVPFSVKDGGSRTAATRDLADGLGLQGAHTDFTILRDHASGLEFLRQSRSLREEGFEVTLGAYQRRVFVDIRELGDETGELADLAWDLAGRGVPSVAEALELRRLRPLHEAVEQLLRALRYETWNWHDEYRAFLDLIDPEMTPADQVDHIRRLRGDIATMTAAPRSYLWLARHRKALEDRFPVGERPAAVIVITAALAPAADRFGELRLWEAIRSALDRFDEEAPERLASGVEVLLRHQQWAEAATVDEVFESLLSDQLVRDYLRVNAHEGVEWFDGDAYQDLVDVLLPAGLMAVQGKDSKAGYRHVGDLAIALLEAEQASGYRVEGLTSGS